MRLESSTLWWWSEITFGSRPLAASLVNDGKAMTVTLLKGNRHPHLEGTSTYRKYQLRKIKEANADLPRLALRYILDTKHDTILVTIFREEIRRAI
jgi:cell division protein FtsI/penicillin-binding protein 2